MIKPIKDFEGYFVSDSGKVFSGEKELRQYTIKGHKCVYLYNVNGRKKFWVHQLIAEAFIENPNNYPIVNHKDEDGSNNYCSNLEWCNHKYNTNYGTCIRRRADNHKKRILQIDKNGKILRVFNGVIDAAQCLNIDSSSISKVALGKRGSAGGYTWKYEHGGYKTKHINA